MLGFERKLSVLVGYPSPKIWTAGFGNCLVNMITYYISKGIPGYREQKVIPYNAQGSILSVQRMMCVKEAMKHKCSHLCFIDTDQTFPQTLLHELIQHDKDVIGCNIATKQIPASPTARKRSTERPDGELVYTDLDSKRLERVWRLGTGIMLIKMRVFEKIGLGCFEVRWDETIQDYRGEDWSMCQAMERAGFEIWVDHRVSNEVGHLGEFKYTHDVVGEKVLVENKVIGEA